MSDSSGADLRFDSLIANVAAAPALDAESDTYRDLLVRAYSLLSPEQRAAFFVLPSVMALQSEAEQWAKDADGEDDSHGDETEFERLHREALHGLDDGKVHRVEGRS